MPAAPRHGDLLQVDGAPVRLNVNPRARRISLRLDARSGVVVATAPSPRGLPQALAFAQTRSGWMAARLAARPSVTRLEPGAVIPLQGRPTPLVAEPGARAARLGPDAIVSGGEGETFARRVRKLLVETARRELTARTAVHVARLGRPLPPITTADAGSRWGSCLAPCPRAPLGRIRYSWRLILAPPEVLDYVAAHEAAHLEQANHSPAFWAVVARLYGDAAPARRWLKQHGPALHAIG